MTFCCGTGDCGRFSLGTSQLATKRDVRSTVVAGGPTGSVNHLTGLARANAKRNGDAVVVAGGPSRGLGLLAGPSVKVKRRQQQLRRRQSVSVGSSKTGWVPFGLAEMPKKRCDVKDINCFNENWKACSMKIVGDFFTQPGRQTAVTPFNKCPSTSPNGCPITVREEFSVAGEVSMSSTNSETAGSSSSQSSSETNTNTQSNTNIRETVNKNGVTNSVNIGIGYGPISIGGETSQTNEKTTTNTAESTTTKQNSQTYEEASSNSWAQTVANTTGKSISKSKAEGTSQEFSIMPGGYAVLTFLPTFKCYHVSVDCGTPWTDVLGINRTVTQQICVPDMGDNGAQGTYSLLYTNQYGDGE